MKPIEIIKKLNNEGYQAYIVGGAIRDSIMDRPIGDVDLATSALPQQVIEIFPKTVPVGIEHGTVIVLIDETPYEVTTFRKDEDYIDYRRPTSVRFIDSLKEDLQRRDFTMNAIAMGLDGELFDPFHGQVAISERKIRTVGNPNERFKEDALRMLRAIRFHSQLSFDIEIETLQAITNNANLMNHISIERIGIELEKTLVGASCQSAMRLISSTGLADFIGGLSPFKEALKEWPALDYTALNTRTEKWTILCLNLQVNEIESFMKKWKLPNKVVKEAITIVEALTEIKNIGWTNELMYKLGEELTLTTARLESVMSASMVEKNLSTRLKLYQQLPILTRKDLVIDGHDLVKMIGKPPGPWISEMMINIESDILKGTLLNTRDSIKEWLIKCNQL
ncbi:CCA tRNA nucleotidyltransferase [Bacillus sp. AK128]